jgi:DNA-binding NtrC family response regulator
LPVLVDHFIEEANRDFKKEVDSIDPEFLAALKTYHWPGNVRELRNVFESAVLMTHSTRLCAEDLPEEIKISTNRETSFTVFLGSPLQEIEQEYRNTYAAPSNSLMETRPEHRKCWASLAGLYTENSSARRLGTNPTADPKGTDTARRGTIQTA